jgi:glycosyltransferase involved in cell wall biosynthesis
MTAQKTVKRILLLVTHLTFGGAETQVVRLAQEYTQLGKKVCVVSMIHPETWVEKLRQSGVEVRSLGMARGLPDPRAILRLRQVIREFCPDVVHCHMFHANMLGRITRLICRMPVVISTVHNLRETSERGGSTEWKELLYRFTDRLGTRTTIICQAAFDRYVAVKAVPRHRLTMIPNGVDVEQFQPSAEARTRARLALGIDNKFFWLAVGRLVAQKDYPNLFGALEQMEGDSFAVAVAGSGPLDAALRAECERRGLNGKVRFLGAREDIRDLYNAADAFVMSSEFEGFSMALLEAACTELPIVATDAGGNREIVCDQTTGFLVPTNNSRELAKAMKQVMDLPAASRLQMGQAGRKFCYDRFQIRRVVEQWFDFYSKCLSGSGHASYSNPTDAEFARRGELS